MLSGCLSLRMQFVLWILLGTAMALFWIAATQSDLCAAALPEKPPSQTTQEQQRAEGIQSVFILASEKDEAGSADHPSQERADERGPFSVLCNAKITDVALVYFTFCLVIVGWIAIKSNEQTVRTLERAYLFLSVENERLADRTWKADLLITNSGRTPGILMDIFVRFSASEPSGDSPIYEIEGAFNVTKQDAVIPSGAKPKILDAGAGVDIVSNPYLFGFFRYQDIWGDTHVSRFCIFYDYLSQSFGRVGPDAWSAWD